MFNSWELASAAYNAGEAKIARAIRRYGAKDYWIISRHSFLRPETRDYVPKIIAAALISKNREQFGFKPSAHRPAQDEAVAGDGEIVKVTKSDKPEETIEGVDDPFESVEVDDDQDSSSPEITPAALTVPLEPAAPEGQFVSNDQPLAKPVQTPHVDKNGEVGGAELAEFEVQSPADLLKIARAAGLSYNTVKALNPELLRWCSPPTVSSYRIKLPAETKEKFLTTYNHAAFPRQVQFMTYKVHKGETLSRIARRYGIRVDPISDLNGVSPRLPLRQGVRILLPMPNDRSRSLASLEVRDPPESRRKRRARRKGPKYYKITYKKRSSARSTPRTVKDSS
jgi:membrane-bound lytic murein transglycosylase D